MGRLDKGGGGSGGEEKGGGGGGRLMKGGRETQTGDQELSVISGSQFIDKLVGQTMK